MIEHIVLFKAKPGIPAEKLDAMSRALSGLQERIPGIIGISAGANFCARAQGYTHGLVVRFAGRS